MLQYERFEAILNKLEEQSSVRVTDLSQELGVSESTIRRDIADLAKDGKIKKVFGGAASLEPHSSGSKLWKNSPAFEQRNVNTRTRNMQEKENIQADEKSEVAAHAAALIGDGDLVYIDAGTTTGRMIDYITCDSATFVTNGVRHAIRLAEKGFQTYLLSGRVKPRTEAVIGHEAVGCLAKYHFSKCFIGTDGIDETCGLTTADIEESMVKREAINRSGDVYVLADSSKFGLVASVTFADLSAVTVITDQLPEESYRGQMECIELRGKQ